MAQVGDTVVVGSRIGAVNRRGVVINVLPANGNRTATLYRVRFEPTNRAFSRDQVPGEGWVDEGLIVFVEPRT